MTVGTSMGAFFPDSINFMIENYKMQKRNIDPDMEVPIPDDITRDQMNITPEKRDFHKNIEDIDLDPYIGMGIPVSDKGYNANLQFDPNAEYIPTLKGFKPYPGFRESKDFENRSDQSAFEIGKNILKDAFSEKHLKDLKDFPEPDIPFVVPKRSDLANAKEYFDTHTDLVMPTPLEKAAGVGDLKKIQEDWTLLRDLVHKNNKERMALEPDTEDIPKTINDMLEFAK